MTGFRNGLPTAQRACLPNGKRALGMLLVLAAIAALPVASLAQKKPVTPIQHVIVVFGENRSFDHVFGTYVPKPGQFVWSLHSLGIVNADGTPGPRYGLAHQYSALDTTTYLINPTGKTLYPTLPDPLAGGDEFCSDTFGEPFCTEPVAVKYEPNLDPAYNIDLTTGATGLAKKTPDTRITNDSSLLPGPFQLTGPALSYHDYTASPVHRFYQMWQQTDCSLRTANFLNPSGCVKDLFPWVEVTIGAGSNGNAQPSNFSTNWCSTCTTTGEGSTSMGFYNVSTGDAPYLTSLANQYALLDNMHQSIMGGTGANHIALGYADAMPYTNGNGSIATPPAGEIENPNPQPGTNNYYTEDGYGNSNPLLIQGGSYTDCADTPLQPGVQPIVTYLAQLHIKPNCAPGNYYLLNNYNPGWFVTANPVTGVPTGYPLPISEAPYTIPPTTQRHIGDVLAAAGLTYYFFGEDWNIYAGIGEPGGVGDPGETNPMDAYCNICNPFQYATDIMSSPAEIAAHIADMNGPHGFYTQLAAGNLPNVSIIQPSGFADGHPATSKLDIWEGFVKNIIESVQANKELWNSTAIILIFDEGGGYYDSGYIQPVDFFGDGTRMPSLIVSRWAAGGKVYHGYADHVSIDKFIERNWNLPTISGRSRDNLPNPVTFINPYVPLNRPALDDLFGAFDFHRRY